MEWLLGLCGVLSAGLLAYLLLAMLKPEMFQ